MTARTKGIKIDLTKHLDDIAKVSVNDMVEGVRSAWIGEAMATLNSSAPEYVQGISTRIVRSSGAYSAEVYLKGKWANALESGFPSYDMKPLFARSNKKKISQDNQWYLHVPMRHTTPNATGRQGTPMPSGVYRRASQLPQWGRMKANSSSSVSHTGYQHKTNIYDGMQKVPESHSSTRNAYFTWRTVSSNSDPHSWIHPGYEGAHIQDRVASQVQDTFAILFEGNVSSALNRR